MTLRPMQRIEEANMKVVTPNARTERSGKWEICGSRNSLKKREMERGKKGGSNKGRKKTAHTTYWKKMVGYLRGEKNGEEERGKQSENEG